MSMITKALNTPGMALTSATTILLRDSMRLNSRKTRNARSIFSWLSGLSGGIRLGIMRVMPTATTMKSKTFHPEFQNCL